MIRTLTEADFPQVHRAFLEAFSDYTVPLSLTIDQLAEMLVRRGYRPDLSAGAIEDDRLVAFTLNGFGMWGGKPTVYDTGTGVVPAHRKRGLSTAIFEFLLEKLSGAGAEQYLLEVIDTNEAAIALYRKLGFEITRRLQCWSLSLQHIRREQVASPITIADGDLGDLAALTVRFSDMEPSWQNSVASIERSRHEKRLITAKIAESIIGLLVVYPQSRDLALLAVDPEQRRRGVATSLLRRAMVHLQSEQPMRILNVDEDSATSSAFLNQIGAHKSVRQFEMVRSL